MATPTLGTFLRRLKQAMSTEAFTASSDQELVERFRSCQDEAVFRAILDRHGPMVFQVCRRVLSAPSDVEDAFQATFLVLVRRGHTIRRQASLASWLHGVARRTALKLRTQADRRRRREGRAAQPGPGRLLDDTFWQEIRSVLDEELHRLPEACRAALVLCYLEGQTQDEAAARLAVSKRTLRRQLDRGRTLLGRRLARRGVAPVAALAARLVSDCAEGASLPHALVLRTAESANYVTAGPAAPAGVLSPQVAALTDGVIKTMYYAKYKKIVAVLACGLAFGVGVQQLSPLAASAQEKSGKSEARPTAAAPDIEPIDPNLVFDPEVQKQLRLSPNQVRQLTEAQQKGGERVADQGKRAAEIDQRIKKLQEEIDRLAQERNAAHEVVYKAQTEQVRATIPKVLSRDAVQQLREVTLQRMRLSDVLLDAKVRARLDLNDEQVKKIQEITEKRNGDTFAGRVHLLNRRETLTLERAELTADSLITVFLSDSLSETSRAELIKVLTPRQREVLERLSGMNLEKKKE